jgi:uncharacterized protein YjlB
MAMAKSVENNNILTYYLKDDGIFPNNELLPVLLYKSAWKLPFWKPATAIEKRIKENQWGNVWRNGVYDYHHYHSITHEVLCAYKGKTKLLLGGDKGVTIEFEKGDVLIIPAGVAHKNLRPHAIFKCIGAYPEGKNYDMNYGTTERPKTDENIKKVPLPKTDPVKGLSGPLLEYWQLKK